MLMMVIQLSFSAWADWEIMVNAEESDTQRE